MKRNARRLRGKSPPLEFRSPRRVDSLWKVRSSGSANNFKNCRLKPIMPTSRSCSRQSPLPLNWTNFIRQSISGKPTRSLKWQPIALSLSRINSVHGKAKKGESSEVTIRVSTDRLNPTSWRFLTPGIPLALHPYLSGSMAGVTRQPTFISSTNG